MLILSPRNIASIRDRSPDSSASSMQQLHGFSRDAILGIVEKDARGFGGHPLPSLGVFREQRSQMHFANTRIVGRQRLPGFSLGPRRDPRFHIHSRHRFHLLPAALVCSAALLARITAIRSSQDLTNDLAPSS